MRRYAAGLYRRCAQMLRDEQEASDAVQEALLRAWRKLSTFRREAPFKSWLYRIATTTCLMRLRSRRRRPEVPLALRAPGFDEDGEHERQVVDWSPLVDKRLQDQELGARIREEVTRLPDKYREVVILADYEHLSMQQIATALGVSVPCVKTRLHRARLSVRQGLTQFFGEDPRLR